VADDKPTLAVVPPVAKKPDTLGQAASSAPEDDADGLTVAELKFVDLSAKGDAMESMAQELGVCSRTLRRWKRRPEVAAAIRDRTTEAMSLARAVLAAGANRAARELEELCVSATPDAARIAACKAVIENATKLAELEDLKAELAEIKTALASLPGNHSRRM
jgi:hypothetical protein